MEFLKQENLRTSFIAKFGNSPQIGLISPGSIALLGEHTAYNEGYVLSAAIDKAICFYMGFSNESKIELHAYDLGESCAFTEADIKRNNKKKWANELIGVIAEFSKRGIDVPALQILFGGDIPSEAGLSSSSAIRCGLAYGLNEMMQLELSLETLASIAQGAAEPTQDACRSMIHELTCLGGKKDQVMQLDCQTKGVSYINFPTAAYSFVECHIPKKNAFLRADYHARKMDCDEGVSLFSSIYQDVKSLREVNPVMLDKHRKEMDPIVFDRCQYIIQENHRILRGSQDLLDEKLEAFGEKMYASHKGLSGKYGVSCPEVDFLVNETLKKAYVLGSRMMAEGTGYTTINLVKKTAVEKFEQETKKAFFDKFGMEILTHELAIAEGVAAFELEKSEAIEIK